MNDLLADFTQEQFTAQGKTRDIYRVGSGPAVIVIAEIPGITPNVAGFARKVAAVGCTAVLPHLFGVPGAAASVSTALKSIGPACVSREFSVWALKRTSPVTVWLRALAAHEHERCGGPGVGAIGMCFTGGFALAMMVDDTVVAPVLSQPSLPFPISKRHKADIGISDSDLVKVKGRVAEGACHRTPFHQRSVLLRGSLRHVAPRAGRRIHRRGARFLTRQPLRTPEERSLGADRTPRRP